jgi:hypothetical protein
MLWSKKKTKLASRKPVTPALKTAVQVTDPNPEACLLYTSDAADDYS